MCMLLFFFFNIVLEILENGIRYEMLMIRRNRALILTWNNCLKFIEGKEILYNTGNYTQYF